MIKKDKKFIFINEEDRKENYEKWNKKIEKLFLGKDIIFIYPSSLGIDLKLALYQFGVDISKSKDKDVLVYEQELGRGGIVGPYY